ncbi:MAG: hypothetical protein U5K00_02880 [Melioribacteraceae bacterium]|nr:hypothetical protein [Melioribacteraceae bacterium]
MMSDFKTIELKNDNLRILDQTKLPLTEEYIETDDFERIAVSIERLEVRGAPAIGVTAAYAIALAFKNEINNKPDYFEKVYNRLYSTRPTAVNLFWALKRMKEVFESHKDDDELFDKLLGEAIAIHQDDIDKCERMAENGIAIFDKPKTVLTHCNTGQLATGGGGDCFLCN